MVESILYMKFFLFPVVVLVSIFMIVLIQNNLSNACTYCPDAGVNPELNQRLNELINETHGKLPIFLADQALEGNYLPLKQLKYKTFGEGKIICKLDFIPIKYDDRFPICVKPNTSAI